MQKNINCILMRTVAVLLMLVLVSTGIVSGRYARYVSSASGEDSARVAKFEVSVSENEFASFFSVEIEPGGKVEKTVFVTNKSEVTVAMDFSVKNVYENLPLQILNQVGGEIAPGQTKKVPLTIYWPEDKTDDSYCGKVDLLKISLTVVQVD